MEKGHGDDEIRVVVAETIKGIIQEELKNGWGKWGVYVTESIKELLADQLTGREDRHDVQRELSAIRMDLEVLKKEMQIKSGMWGLLGGAVPIIIGLLVYILQRLLSHAALP